MSRKDESRSCAACRYSRLKCSPDCPLAFYFPGTKTQKFQNVIRMYDPSQLKETLRLITDRGNRDAAVRAIIQKARDQHRRSRAAGIQEHHAVQPQLQDINRCHVPDYVPGPGPISVPGSGLYSCPACRYSRLNCSPDCPLAAYFPSARTQDFQDVFRMYHPSHIKETLRLIKNKHDRDAAVGNIILGARDQYRRSRAAGIQEHHAVQAQLQDIKCCHVPGPGPIPVPGSGLYSCAACRYSRLNCSPDCPLAAYFPVPGNQDFQDLIRIYHPSHIKEMLRLIKNKHERDAAVRTIILEARCRRAAGIQAQFRETNRRVLVLGEPISDATGPGQETETRSGVGSSTGSNRPGSSKDETTTEFGSGSGRTGREFGLDGSTMADLYRFVSPILKSWICQEMEARSEPGLRDEEVTTEFWTPEDGDMTWIEDTIKYFFDGEE